jgi:hypothetical protein
VLQRGEIYEYKCESAASDFELAGLVTAGQGSVGAFLSAESYIGGNELEYVTAASSQRIAADSEFPITAAVAASTAANSSSLYAYVTCGGQPEALSSEAAPATELPSTTISTTAHHSDECTFSLQMLRGAGQMPGTIPAARPPPTKKVPKAGSGGSANAPASAATAQQSADKWHTVVACAAVMELLCTRWL